MGDITKRHHRGPVVDEPNGNRPDGTGSVDLEDAHRKQFGHNHVA